MTVQVVLLGEAHIARLVHQPGWSWAEHVKPVAGTPSCQHHHQGVVLEGQVEIETDTGVRVGFFAPVKRLRSRQDTTHG